MPDTESNVLLHITGPDYPGILAGLTDRLLKHNAGLLDVQQTTCLGQLSLSLIISIPKSSGLDMLKDVAEDVKAMRLQLDFRLLSESEIIEYRSQRHFVLTVLTDHLTLTKFQAIAAALGRLRINIEKMSRIAGGKPDCLEFNLKFPEAPDASAIEELRRDIFQLANLHQFDIALQPENLFRRSKRLIVFDMDSTLIRQEVIDELADFAGLREQVARITERAMQGELDFRTALHERVSLLAGLPVSALDGVLERISLTPGAEHLVRVLKRLGFKIAVISGGFTFFTRYFQEKLGLDASFANELEVIDGKLTGRISGEIVDRSRKAQILKELAESEKVPLDQTVAVGDGANDLDMLATAGLGIAFNAKPQVRNSTRAFVSLPSLDSVLYLLGVPEAEVADLAL